MLKGISGKTSIVTGAAGGIGGAAVRPLHAEGANVVAVDFNQAGVDVLKTELDDRILPICAADTAMFFTAAVDAFGSGELFHANANANANAGVESRVLTCTCALGRQPSTRLRRAGRTDHGSACSRAGYLAQHDLSQLAGHGGSRVGGVRRVDAPRITRSWS